MKDGDRLLIELKREAEIRDRCYQFLQLFLCGCSYTPDWLYWREWVDASRS